MRRTAAVRAAKAKARTGAHVDEHRVELRRLARHVEAARDRHEHRRALVGGREASERVLRGRQLIPRDLKLLDRAVQALKLLLDRLLQLVELLERQREEINTCGNGIGSVGT